MSLTPFPISLATPVTYPGPPAPEADLVVIGAGVIGVCTAIFAARRGLRVVLCEKGRIAGEQSSRNWGWIRRQGRDPSELPIMIEASALWRQLASETNTDIGLREQGVTYLTRDARDMERYASWLRIAQDHGLETEVYDAKGLAQRFPALAGQGIVGGMTTARDQRAEPWVAVPALAGIAAREGVTIVESCAVRALERAAGRVTGVMTEQGLIRTPQVVVAAGAWSSLFLRAHGVHIPQLSVRASVAATSPVDLPHAGAVTDGRVAFRARADGGLSIAAPALHELFIGPDAFRHFRAYLPQLRTDPLGTRFHARAPQGFPDAWSTPRRWAADQPSPFEAMRILNPRPNL
ncbi:MAG: NAD(P)/FAD-dependent oxidoreductase, partial [Primorskyibacter sp.]